MWELGQVAAAEVNIVVQYVDGLALVPRALPALSSGGKGRAPLDWRRPTCHDVIMYTIPPRHPMIRGLDEKDKLWPTQTLRMLTLVFE